MSGATSELSDVAPDDMHECSDGASEGAYHKLPDVASIASPVRP